MNTNKWNLKVNDKVVLTYNDGTKKELIVSRVTDKSWFTNNNRNSYGTLQRYFNLVGDIVKCEIL